MDGDHSLNAHRTDEPRAPASPNARHADVASPAGRAPTKVVACFTDLSIRTDLQEFISELRQLCHLRLLVPRKDESYARKLGVDYAVVGETRQPLSDRLWTYIFKYSGEMPRHGEHYKAYVWRRAYRDTTRLSVGTKLRLRLETTAGYLSYDAYLRHLSPASHTFDPDDVLLMLTNVVDDGVLASAVQQGIPTFLYVYSWDHIAKFKKFPKRGVRYLSWNEALKNDLQLFHGISSDHVTPVGSSQLCYVKEAYDAPTASPMNYSYVYAVGTFGYPIVAEQEVTALCALADSVAMEHPSWKVLFRPYPLLAQQGVYDQLLSRNNVELDAIPTRQTTTPRQDAKEIRRKYTLIKHAEGFFHVGSTLGLEAAYFDTPVLTIRGKAFDSNSVSRINKLSTSLNQWHIQRHLTLRGYENVASTEGELRSAVRSLSNPEAMLAYNHTLRAFVNARSMREFTTGMLQRLTGGSRGTEPVPEDLGGEPSALQRP